MARRASSRWPRRRTAAARGLTTGAAEPDDVALVLHTSGTAARPKLVPLTHRNICASAQNIRAALELTPADRCLSVMPLFHIHGLSAVFASLAAGASVVCTGPVCRCAVLRVAGGVSPDLVHGGAHDPPGDPGARVAPSRRRRALVAAIHPFRLRGDAAAAHRRSGTGVRRPVHRSLRDDRGRAADREQPAPAAGTETGLGGTGRGARRRDHGRRGTSAAAGTGRRSRDSRRERDVGLRRRSRGHAPRLRPGLVPDRRHRATWMRTASSSSPAVSRRSSTAAGRRSRRERWTRSCWTTPRWRRP